MPSSTSNSNDRLPRGPYGRIFALAVVLFVFGVVALEMIWRQLGYSPSVTDNEALWSYHRHLVEEAGPETVVILGRSRIKQAFVMSAWREVEPDRPAIQLAINGRHPIAALKDIAENTQFNGVILCELVPQSLMPELWDQQQAWIDYYHDNWGPIKQRTTGVKIFLQSRFVILLPDLLLQRVLPDIAQGKLTKQYLWTAFDRTEYVDYRGARDVKAEAESQLKKNKTLSEGYSKLDSYTTWTQQLAVIDAHVKTIKARGGKVVFFRTVTSGDYYRIDEAFFPRTQYWDVFAAQTSGITLFFSDVPEMAAMECAEGSHLYYEDAVVFTKMLARELHRLGAF